MRASHVFVTIAIAFAALVGCSKPDNGTGVDATTSEAVRSDAVVGSGEEADFVLTNGKVYTVNEHNDLMNNIRYQARLSGVRPYRIVPVNPFVSFWLLMQARVHGLTSRIAPQRPRQALRMPGTTRGRSALRPRLRPGCGWATQTTRQ